MNRRPVLMLLKHFDQYVFTVFVALVSFCACSDHAVAVETTQEALRRAERAGLIDIALPTILAVMGSDKKECWGARLSLGPHVLAWWTFDCTTNATTWTLGASLRARPGFGSFDLSVVAAQELEELREFGRFVLDEWKQPLGRWYFWMTPAWYQDSNHIQFSVQDMNSDRWINLNLTKDHLDLTEKRWPDLTPLWNWLRNESHLSWMRNLNQTMERWRVRLLEPLSVNDTEDRVKIRTSVSPRENDEYYLECTVRSAGPLPIAVRWNTPGTGKTTLGSRTIDNMVDTARGLHSKTPRGHVCQAWGYRWQVEAVAVFDGPVPLEEPDEIDMVEHVMVGTLVCTVAFLFLAGLECMYWEWRLWRLRGWRKVWGG